MCRAVGMIQTPGGVPFERYVEDAFRTELAVAGLLADPAPVTLSGHLERMHFSTANEASWERRTAPASRLAFKFDADESTPEARRRRARRAVADVAELLDHVRAGMRRPT